MYTLVEIGILNALTAGALAIVVLLISPLVRRPAVIHACWVLVLLKLVTPPVFEIPIGLRMERLASLTNPDDSAGSVTMLEQTRSMPSEAATPATPLRVDSGRDDPPAVDASIGDGDLKLAAVAIQRNSPGSLAGMSRQAVPRRWLALAIPILLWVWLAGTVAWFVIQGWRIVAFLRLMTTARLASDEIQQQTQRLALAIGARRAPRIWVLDVTMSPILWAFGSRARVIFPADLLDRVDPQARATLLTHELAHFRRGDHWVRLLEFVVTGLFWWHPAIWIARRKIEVAEEHCCDAWVISQFPRQPRRYAEALLDTIDFLSEQQPRVVPVASGLGQAAVLARANSNDHVGGSPQVDVGDDAACRVGCRGGASAAGPATVRRRDSPGRCGIGVIAKRHHRRKQRRIRPRSSRKVALVGDRGGQGGHRAAWRVVGRSRNAVERTDHVRGRN